MGNAFYNWSTILNMKKIILFSVILFFCVNQEVLSQKGVRIGYIDMNVILENIDEYIIAQTLIDKRVEVWKKEIELQKLQLKNIKMS